MYPRKANALFFEFEEIGINRQLGYSSPAAHLESGIKYLNKTVPGRQWIANLQHHVLCAERSNGLMGPQEEELKRGGWAATTLCF
jgi:hypothetical protein